MRRDTAIAIGLAGGALAFLLLFAGGRSLAAIAVGLLARDWYLVVAAFLIASQLARPISRGYAVRVLTIAVSALLVFLVVSIAVGTLIFAFTMRMY